MWTVYFLRYSGTNDAIYVGSTKKPLALRLDGHKNQGVNSLKYRPGTRGPIVLAKAVLMDQFDRGEVDIEIVGVRTTEVEAEARAMERALVEALRPQFNTSLHVVDLPPLVVKPGEPMLRYREAARVFGYRYQTIRTHVCQDDIRAIDKRIPYSEMQRYMSSRKMSGRPRNVERQQLQPAA